MIDLLQCLLEERKKDIESEDKKCRYWAEKMKAKAEMKPYRPANGTEGFDFMDSHCGICECWIDCSIDIKAMMYEIDDSEYPKEWIIQENGVPTCTAFVRQEEGG